MSRQILSVLMAVGLCLSLAASAAAQTTINAHHTVTVVGQTSVLARAALSFRKYLGLINDSGDVVYCTVDGETAVANTGIRLAATGTTGDRIFFDRAVPLGAVRCIAAAGTNYILVIEGR